MNALDVAQLDLIARVIVLAGRIGSNFPSIFEVQRQVLNIALLRQVVKYLTQNPVCIASPGVVFSAFDAKDIAGTSSIMTDGVWVWPDTLPFYIQKPSIALPEKFFEHMKRYAFVPLRESDIDINRLNFPW